MRMVRLHLLCHYKEYKLIMLSLYEQCTSGPTCHY
jgi:hypothetical protein